MAYTDALLGGGFVLLGAALQQAVSWRTDQRRYLRERLDHTAQEQHLAFLDLVRAARRVQRALVDLSEHPSKQSVRDSLNEEVDRLTDAVAVVRLVIKDVEVVTSAEAFERQAKEAESLQGHRAQQSLKLTPLIEVLQRYEAKR